MIQVYGGGDSVELFVNGKSLGVKACGRETGFEAQFHTDYEPGELLAVAYEDGKEIGRTSLSSAAEPSRLGLSAEKYETLAFVNIDVLDERGVLAADSKAELSLAIDGPAELLGFAGVNARHRRGYCLSNTTAGDGHALAVLKLTGEDGKITVKVSGDSLAETAIEI